MTSFNLVSEPWIPVVVAGQRRLASIKEALTTAHEIDGLSLEDPLQAAAVYRQVLIPLVLDALGAPQTEEEWAARLQRLDVARIEKYLGTWAGRFDLFDDTAPFAQVTALRTESGETKPVSLLVPSLATGNNVPIFCARTEADSPSLSPSEAALALLSVHCWDTAAIKTGVVGDPKALRGKTTGNPTGPLGQLGLVLPMGATLAETLVLNLPLMRQGLRRDDRPQWRAEVAGPSWQSRPAHGLLDLLTWQARRVRLIPELDDSGRLIVRRVVLAAGDRLDQLPEFEPHTAWVWVENPKAGQAPRRPIRHQPGRAAWRGLTALLATHQPSAEGASASRLLTQVDELRQAGVVPENLALQVLAVGVAYGNQSAVVEDVMVDLLPLPVAALAADNAVRQLIEDVVDQAEQLRKAANHLGDDLRLAAGGDKLPWDKSQRLGDLLIHQLDPVVRRLLVGLQKDPDLVEEADRAWREKARRLSYDVAEPLLAAVPPTGFFGHEVKDKGKVRVVRLSTAEMSYRSAITKALGPPPGNTPTPPIENEAGHADI